MDVAAGGGGDGEEGAELVSGILFKACGVEIVVEMEGEAVDEGHLEDSFAVVTLGLFHESRQPKIRRAVTPPPIWGLVPVGASFATPS